MDVKKHLHTYGIYQRVVVYEIFGILQCCPSDICRCLAYEENLITRLLNKWMFSPTRITAKASEGCFVKAIAAPDVTT